MSAPDTNVEKQELRHKPTLFGIKSVLVYAAVLFTALIIWTVAQSDENETAGSPAAVAATE